MEKLTGKKINTAVFISGSGSNLNSIINNWRVYSGINKISAKKCKNIFWKWWRS